MTQEEFQDMENALTSFDAELSAHIDNLAKSIDSLAHVKNRFKDLVKVFLSLNVISVPKEGV
jgi:archaellum component FlaC